MSAVLAHIAEQARRNREDWRFTDFDKLARRAVTTHAPANAVAPMMAGAVRLVVRDGRFVAAESALQKELLSVEPAGDGLKIAVASSAADLRIEVVHVFSAEQGAQGHLLIDVPADANVTLVECHLCAGKPAAASIACEVTLGANARLSHIVVATGFDVPTSSAATVRVAAGAKYALHAALFDVALFRAEYKVELAAETASCDLNGLLLLRGRNHADVLTRVMHRAPNCQSQQLFKAIVREQGRGVFQGRIAVAEAAQKTEARQLCRALLLSDQAEMDAKPELEIFADDVACSHGCAIGEIDRDALFYLRARGIEEAEARGLLLNAFAAEVIEHLPDTDVAAVVQSAMEGWMKA